MPWTCSGCATEVGDDARGECPTCGQRKTSWTIVQDKTRTMVVTSKKRFEPLRGEWDAALTAPLDGAADAYEGATWLATDVVPAMHVDAARALAAEGKLPAPRDLLVVREFAGGAADRALKVTVEFAQRAAEDRVVPGPTGEPSPEGGVDARVLAVWGASGPVDDLAFPGVTALDVSEDTPEGHAPTIKVSALKRPARQLRVVVSTGVYRGLMVGMFFDTDLAFLLPGAVPAMKRLRQYYDEHPGVEVLVVGHTDTTGAPEHNLVLSNERAEAVAAYLRDDVDHWVGYFTASRGVSKPWGTREVQWMLSALPDDGPRFHAGPPSGVQDPATTDAVGRFQAWSNETRGTALDVDGICGPLTRRELVAAYMEIDGTTLPEGTVLRTHGCGEFHPVVDAGDGADVQENRRVELFLFDPPGIRPQPGACVAPGCPEYAQWLAAVVHTIDLTLPRPACPPQVGVRLPSLFSLSRTFPKPSAIPQLREVAARLDADPALRAVIVGHCDTSGSDFTNLHLSQARAEAVARLLTGDAAFFRARFATADPLEPWGWEEVQWMLSAVPAPDGSPCYAGIVDGVPGRVTEAALALFQVSRGLPASHDCREEVLAELIAAYLELVGPTRPARERLDVVGGGSWHPPRPLGPASDEELAAARALPREARAYRRVEVFLGAAVLPPPPACPASTRACVAYDAWCDAVVEELPAPPARAVGRVVDALRRPLAGVEVTLLREQDGALVPAGSVTSSASGCVTIEGEPGLYAVKFEAGGGRGFATFLVAHDEVVGFTAILDRRVRPAGLYDSGCVAAAGERLW